MDVKTMLKSIRSLRHELELLKKQELLMISPRGVSYGMTKVQTSQYDQMFKTVEIRQKLAKKIEDIEYELSMRQLEAVCLIYSLDNPDYRRVLILYYLDGDKQKNWNDVAELMDYSESRVKHFHGWALEELERFRWQQDTAAGLMK